MFSAANAYAIPYASELLDVPMSSSGYSAEERSVPFYQIALHGLRAMSVPSVNSTGDIRDALLYAVETGVSLKFTLGARNVDSLTGTDYSALSYIDSGSWLDTAVSMYGEAEEYLSKVADKFIVAHKELANGVYHTKFSDGTAVTVNYNQTDIEADGRIVSAKSFVVG